GGRRGGGGGCGVSTPERRAWWARLAEAGARPRPAPRLPARGPRVASLRLPAAAALGFGGDATALPRAGEAVATRRLRRFLAGAVARYPARRDLPAEAGRSPAPPHLPAHARRHLCPAGDTSSRVRTPAFH